MATREIVINELLCYVSNKFKISNPTNKQLKLVLTSFYTEDEIIRARDLLYESAGKVWSDIPRKINRTRSDNRVKLLVDDIVEYMTKLDEGLLLELLPVYVACAIDRIPNIAI